MTAHTPDPRFKAPEFLLKMRELILTSKFLFRDTDLTAEELLLYQIGTFFRERTMFDCTSRFGGIVGNTRFVIISSSPRSLAGMSATPGWGLTVFQPGQLFKVSDIEHSGGRNLITLVHVPAGLEEYFQSSESVMFEKWVLPQAREDFKEALGLAPIPELLEKDWRERTAKPPGLDAQGRLIAV